jgi:SAM-dependent methyltransferase
MAENQGAANKNKAYAISDVEGTRKLYAEWAENYDKDTTEGMGYVAPVVVADLSAEFLDKGTPVLDLACGTGQLGVELKERGFSIMDGLDLSPEMLAVAEALGIYRNLGEIDMTQPYDLPEGSVEALTCCGIFGPSVIGPEHLVHLAAPMKSGARAVLSINGKGYEERPFEEALEALFDDGLFREIYRGFNDYLPKEDIDALYVVLERF